MREGAALTSPCGKGMLRARNASDLRAFLAWTAVLILAAGALAAAAFTSRDPDSTVYAGVSARLAALPIG